MDRVVDVGCPMTSQIQDFGRCVIAALEAHEQILNGMSQTGLIFLAILFKNNFEGYVNFLLEYYRRFGPEPGTRAAWVNCGVDVQAASVLCDLC